MRLGSFLTKSRIIEAGSPDFKGVLAELLAVIPESVLPSKLRAEALRGLIEKEDAVSTYLESGVCVPHILIPKLKRKYAVAVGRCRGKIRIRANEEPKDVSTVFLLLSNDASYMETLSLFTKLFSSDSEVVEKIKNAPDLASYRDAVLGALRPQTATAKDAETFWGKDGKTNKLVLASAMKIAKVAKCSMIMLMGDSFKNFADVPKFLDFDKVAVVSDNPALPKPEKWQMINVKAFSPLRFSQVRSAIMIGITRGIIDAKDRICCIGGVLGSGLADSIIVLDIEKEFSSIFKGRKNLLPDGVKPEVIERVIGIANELSVEGREGKPVGSIFVIGDIEELRPHIKQLILNPFYGYKPDDRNILNPFMDETVKEYSLIDGAIIIGGNGILEAAGALIHTPDFKLQLPGGLGARHAAAYSISLIADCIVFAVSSSTGQITLFRKGQMLPISEKRKG